MPRPIVLVTGATGRQGGSVLRHLAGGPFDLRAMTRSPDKPSALALRAPGIDVIAGDLDDEASLRRACEGATAVYSVQDPWAHGVPREIEQGERLVAVAKAAGVEHVVYASVATADQPTGVPHFESKGRIERALAQSGMAWTFVRPVFFMDMLLPWAEKDAAVFWGALFRGGKPIQLVSADDIGAVSALAFKDRAAFAGQAVELVADEVHLGPAREAFAAAVGKRPRRVVVPFWLMGLVNHEAAVNFEWIRDTGWHVDLAACRARFPFLQRFDAWLQRVSAKRGRRAPG